MMKFNTTPHIAPSGEKSLLVTQDWSTFKVADLVPEITALIAEGKALADTTAAKSQPTFNDLVLVWQEFNERFGRVVGPMHHLNGVMQADYPGLREAIKETTKPLSDYSSDISLHEGLYGAYKRFRESEEYSSLSAPQKYLIDEKIKKFELVGVGLSKENKAILKQLSERESELGEIFGNNIQDVQDAWVKHVLDVTALKGIPDASLVAMKKAAEKKDKEGWLITLQQPDVMAVLGHADNRALREEVYCANITKASELDAFKGKHDNAPVIAEMLQLAHQHANLLGFANTAELSLAEKMAKSVGVEGVSRFIDDLATLARPKALEELEEMKMFARTQIGIDELAPWDLLYVSEKLQNAKHNLDHEALRLYFPFSKVSEALSSLLSSLYGVTLVRKPEVKGWSDSVDFFEVIDRNGVLRAGCYVDLFSREGKRSGAWMNDSIHRLKLVDGTQIPVAYIICNFRKSPDGGETYLIHEEIQTIFHEFGHGFHHMLGTTEYADLGMGGVEWDTIELPSQFMENFTWDRNMLKEMSAHKETGAQIPDVDIDKLLGAKHFNTGLFTTRQVLFGAFDWELYRDHNPKKPIPTITVWRDTLRRIEVRPTAPHVDRFPNAFGHIFAGGYSAGYFSYNWALGLSADAFAVFEESGDIRSSEVGRRFQKEILEPGSSRPMEESFRAFRGRDLDPRALAKELGLLPK